MSEPIYSAAQVAAMLGLTDTSVRRLARNLGVGQLLSPRVRVFTPSEIELLRRRQQPGRPRKDAGAGHE